MGQNRAVLKKSYRLAGSMVLAVLALSPSLDVTFVPKVLGASVPSKSSSQLAVPGVPSSDVNVSNSRITATDKTFTPQDNNLIYYFTIPKWGKPKDVSVNIDYQYSSRLVNPSSLTLMIDDTPKATIPLDGSKQTSGTLHEVISAADLTPGTHMLTVSTNLRSTNNVCTDYRDPGNWLVLLKTSTLHIDYSYNAATAMISEYPFPFLLTNTTSPWKLDLVVPTHPTEDDLNATEAIVDNWTRNQYISPSSVVVKTADEWNGGKDGKPFIFVGDEGELPSPLHSDVKMVVSSTEGELRQVNLGSQQAGLIVTGRSGQGVETSAKALSYPKLVQQLNVKQALITPDLVSNAEQEYQAPNDVASLLKNNKVTLQQLGYSIQTIDGYGVGSTSFSVQTPLNWAYTAGAGLELYVKNSPLLQNDSSLVVSINGDIAKTIPLSHLTAGGESYFVSLPQNMNPEEDLNVSIQAFLDIAGGICEGEPDGRRYVTIEPTSYFVLPHHLYTTTSLGSFPNLFMGNDNNLENTSIVVPTDATQNQLSTALQIAAAAATNTAHGHFPITFTGVQNQKQGQNVILISTGATNTSLQKLQSEEQYPLQLTANGMKGTGVPVAAPTSNYGGFAFQIYRPKGGVAMVLAAHNDAALLPISQTISNGSTLSTLTTDSFLETEDSQVVPLNLQTRPYETPIKRVKSIFQQGYGFMFAGKNNRQLYYLAFAISLIGILIYFIWNTIAARRARKALTPRSRLRKSQRRRGKH